MQTNHAINRRRAVAQLTMLAGGSCALSRTLHAADVPRKTRMGIVAYDCGLRSKWLKQNDPGHNLFEPLTFLKHCETLGAGGVQVNLGALQPAAAAALREYSQAHDMFIEAIVSPPSDRQDLARFEAEIKSAREAGAKAARTVIIPGRRYEHFKSFAEFQQAEKRGAAMVELAVPVVEKHQVPLAIENHKDQRIDQRLALLERISSPYVGACIDTGNSLALLDDLYGTIAALAPFAFSVHFKDQALSEYDDGFLLGDIPLGQGSFDLKRIIQIIRDVKPQLQFCLEIITRDALKVPCLHDDYWRAVTEPTGRDVARTLHFVRTHSTPSQAISQLPLVEQVAIEDANIEASLNYAGKELGL